MGQPFRYRRGSIDAIRIRPPWQFFARRKPTRGPRWTPQRPFRAALLMAWSAEQTLGERFTAVRDPLHTSFPQWRPGATSTGRYEARARRLERPRPAPRRAIRRSSSCG